MKKEESRPEKLTALLKSLMAQRSITPTQLANDLGLNPSNVTGFLKGQKNPTLSTIDRIAAVLQVPAWMLLSTPAEVIADLQAAGLMPEPEAPAAAPSKDTDEPAQPTESPQDGRKFDLCTIDPVTGETRLYRLVKA